MQTTRIRSHHAMIRRLATLAAFAAMVFGSAATANASTDAGLGTEVTPDAGWQQFETDGGVGGTSSTGPFNFESTKLTKVTVTDAYCHGDEFSVLDNGGHLGDTSAVPEDLINCSPRFYLSDTVRADASMADPTFSHGTFYVGPGSHSLEFANKTIWNGTDAGSVAYFRLETVLLDKADCKVGGWESFGTLFANQGQCISLSNALQHQTAANVGTVTFETSPFGTAARGLTPPEPNWHKWASPRIFQPVTYTALRTTPITQKDPGREVLTTTVPVSLTAAGSANPAVVTATLTMSGQPQFVSLIAVGQYGSLGNAAWELVGDPTLSTPSMDTTWTFRSTAPVTPGVEYDPIVVSFSFASTSAVTSAVYNFAFPTTAIVSATADGYVAGTGSGWYLPER